MNKQVARILFGMNLLLIGTVIVAVVLGALALGWWLGSVFISHTQLAWIPIGLFLFLAFSWFIGYIFETE